MKTKKIELAIIPFENLVLFPNASVPLYIFDPIYIKLIDDCLKDKRSVSLALSDPMESTYAHEDINILRPRKICGVGEITLLKEYPDNSKYILIEGKGRACLKQPIQSYPYLICEAELLTDFAPKVVLEDKKIKSLRDLLDQWLTMNFPDSEQRNLFAKNLGLPASIMDYVSTFLIQDREIKQILLENNNSNEKLELISLLLRNSGQHHEDRYTAEVIKSFELHDSLTGTHNH